MQSTSLPSTLRQIEPFVNIASQYGERDVVIQYLCLCRAVDDGLKIDSKSQPAKNYLSSLLSLLEKIKSSNLGNETLCDDNAAKIHLTNEAERLFCHAEKQDSAGVFNMNVVKAFYTSNYLMEVLCGLGDADENLQSVKKYAKWRAAYIHTCLKNGETPMPGNKLSEGAQIKSPKQAVLLNTGFLQQQSSPLEVKQKVVIDEFRQPAPVIDRVTKPQQQQSTEKSPHPGLNDFDVIDASTPQLGLCEPSPDLTLDDTLEAKKFIKYALSALDYDDPRACVENLNKATDILQKR